MIGDDETQVTHSKPAIAYSQRRYTLTDSEDDPMQSEHEHIVPPPSHAIVELSSPELPSSDAEVHGGSSDQEDEAFTMRPSQARRSSFSPIEVEDPSSPVDVGSDMDMSNAGHGHRHDSLEPEYAGIPSAGLTSAVIYLSDDDNDEPAHLKNLWSEPDVCIESEPEENADVLHRLDDMIALPSPILMDLEQMDLPEQQSWERAQSEELASEDPLQRMAADFWEPSRVGSPAVEVAEADADISVELTVEEVAVPVLDLDIVPETVEVAEQEQVKEVAAPKQAQEVVQPRLQHLKPHLMTAEWIAVARAPARSETEEGRAERTAEQVAELVSGRWGERVQRQQHDLAAFDYHEAIKASAFQPREVADGLAVRRFIC
jgi:hypothetical protein